VAGDATREQAIRLVNASVAVQREGKRRRRVDSLGTRISSVVARALGIDEDTVSDGLARVLDTSRDGAHVFLLETFAPLIPSGRRKAGIATEVRSAAMKGEEEFRSTLTFVTDDKERERLERAFFPLARRTERRKRG